MTGMQRLITFMWWILWPLSALLALHTAWVLPLEYKLYVGLVVYWSFKGTWKRRAVVLYEVEKKPVITTLEWFWILLIPYILFFAALTTNNDAPEHLFTTMAVSVLAVLISSGIFWVLRGFANK